jgi:hypothetical protein
MKPERMILASEIRFIFAVIATQIKLDTRNGLTDLSKSQENSLLELINLAYATEFEDMNRINPNYAAIDYGDCYNGLGLQMTVTVTKQKFQNTLIKLLKYDSKQSFKELWFFLLIVDAVPSNVMLYDQAVQIKYITLNDMINEIVSKDLDIQRSFLNTLKQEYFQYFRLQNRFNIPQNVSVPNDLVVFNNFIQTVEWFTENPNLGYEKVYNFIDNFQRCLCRCSYPARTILAYILKVQGIPSDYNSKVKIYLDHLMGGLNIDDDNFDDFKYQLDLLVASELVDIENEFQGLNGLTIELRPVVVLSFQTYEPEINLFSVLPNFYIKYHSLNEYFLAIENADFSLLSDQKIINM